MTNSGPVPKSGAIVIAIIHERRAQGNGVRTLYADIHNATMMHSQSASVTPLNKSRTSICCRRSTSGVIGKVLCRPQSVLTLG